LRTGERSEADRAYLNGERVAENGSEKQEEPIDSGATDD